MHKRDGIADFRLGLLLLCGAAILMYLPVLAGYVPFPADIVLFFPPWEGIAKACCAGVQHAELGDLVTQVYPWRTVLNSALSAGRVPLWNYHYLMGAPYQAMTQSAIFFPLNWLYSILKGPLAWSLLFIIRTALIGTSMAIYVRRLGASNAAALISGFTFSCSGWMMAFEGWPDADTAMWLPLMFLSVDCMREKQSAASISLGAVAFALPALAGNPEVAFQVILLAVFYAACRVFPLASPRLPYLASLSAAGALALGLAAVQVLPTLEWVRLIARSLSAFWPPIPAKQIIAFLSRDIFHQPNIDGVSVPEQVAYVGAFALAALPFAWLWPKRRDVLYFAGILFFSLSMVYGWDPIFSISRFVPVLRGLPNWRFLVGADFALVVLMGLAISAIESRCVEPKSGAALQIVALQVGVAVCALIVARITGHTAIPFYLNAGLVVVALTVLWLAKAGMLQPRSFTGLALALVAADLFSFGYGHIPFVRPDSIYPANATFDFLKQHAGTSWRVGPVDTTYGNNFELAYGLSEAAGYDTPTARIARFLGIFSNNPDPLVISWNSERLIAAPKGALDLTGTRFFVATTWNKSASRLDAVPNRFRKVFASGTSEIFENQDAMPAGFFVPSNAIHVVNSDEGELRGVLAPDFDPRRSAITPEAVNNHFGVRGSASSSALVSMRQDLNETRFEVTAASDGLFIFDETYYPGWKAEVDGSAAPVVRADYAFMGVPITQGRHDVVFRFAPRLARAGGLLSGSSALLIMIILLARPLFRSKTKQSCSDNRPSA